MGLVAVLAYAARLVADGHPARTDLLFRYGTALATVVVDGALLVVMLLIARGLPPRDVFALRAPASWSRAARIGLAALSASWGTSLVIEIVAGHALREQAMPLFWDPARAPAFLANALVIAGFVPLVEEAACRGVGFALLLRYGERTAIAGSALAFALAHGALLDLPWVLVTGLGLGYLRARTGSLYPGILLHATVNGVAIAAAALAGIGR